MVNVWDDVRMDASSAHAAARELRQVADEVSQLADDRSLLAAEAVDRWRGAARERFDDDLHLLQSEASQLVAGLRAAASQIDGALQDAYAEQRRRERRREDIREQRTREAQVR
jgi:uncharacterized protein YukE